MVLEAVCAPLFCQHKVYLLGLPEIYTFSLSKRAKAQGMNIVILPLCFVCVWRKIERDRERERERDTMMSWIVGLKTMVGLMMRQNYCCSCPCK